MARTDFLRPSSAATWLVCSGYIAMRAMYPDAPEEADNDVREDGTAAHWLANELWNGRIPPVNSMSPNGRTLTEEMFDDIDGYLDVLRQEAWQLGTTCLEEAISCAIIHPKMRGTPDAHTLVLPCKESRGRLRVADLKYGFRFVEVMDNPQLIIYALSLGELYSLPDEFMVELSIYQPRSFHRDGIFRVWNTTMGHLRTKWLPVLQSKAKLAIDGLVPPCTPNPHCTDCPARHACVALQQASFVALQESYSSIPVELPPAAVGNELRLLKEASKLLEARITGLTAQTESLIKAGQVVPHWSLVPSYARERWRDDVASQVLTLGRYYNKDLAKPAAPVSPAQARKNGVPAELVALYSHKPSTGVKLVNMDEITIRKIFRSDS